MQLNLFDDLAARAVVAPVAVASEPGAMAEHAVSDALDGDQSDENWEGMAQPDPMDPLPVTLAELAQWLKTRPDASTRKVKDMHSALNGIGRVLERKLADIPTDPAKLGQLFGKAQPAIALMTRQHWSAVRSRLRLALEQAGFEVMPGRDVLPWRQDWQAMSELLPDRRAKTGLSRLISYLSRKGVAPEDVSVEDILAFEKALNDRSLKKDPKQLFRSTVRRWNVVAEEVGGWPSVIVPLEKDSRKYALPWEDFPASLKADVDAFLSNAADQDVFSDTYAKPVRASTNDNRRNHISELASALVLSGRPATEIASLADLVRPENAKQALRWHMDRNGRKTSSHISGMAYLLLTLARHWVRDPDAVETLARYCDGLKLAKKGMVEKNRTRLRQFDHPDNKAALLQLPAKVLGEAQKDKSPSSKVALRVMNALAVEILTVAPMRISNLAQIEIEKHLIQIRRGKNKRFHIIFTPEETKTREPFEMELPASTVALLEVYLNVYRPLLDGADGPILFPGRAGARRNSTTFATSIAKFVERETGIKMNVHLFRHLAGKIYLDANPHDVETVRRILGHTSVTTTLNNYAELRSDQAFRRYDQVVADQRVAQQTMPLSRRAPFKAAKRGDR